MSKKDTLIRGSGARGTVQKSGGEKTVTKNSSGPRY